MVKLNKNISVEKNVAIVARKRKLFKKDSQLMLMVSGGSDSVALCYIIDKIQNGKKNFAIMHLDHMLRENSADDAQFVENLAAYFNVPYYGFQVDVAASDGGENNIEAAGHKIRYQCANEACKQWAKDHKIKDNKIVICTAHTGDDRIENFYMRSIVGTGPGGFAGINYKNENVSRPLLDFPKEKLREYIEELDDAYEDNYGRKWVEDETNQDTDRFRAYVRHKIIPLAKRQNPNVIDNLTNSMNLIADEAEFIERQVEKVTNEYIEIDDDTVKIKPGFADEDLVLKRRAIYNSLCKIFKPEVRLEYKTIQSILDACEQSNYTDNIQQNYSVHSNKKGVIIQPMKKYRESRNRI